MMIYLKEKIWMCKILGKDTFMDFITAVKNVLAEQGKSTQYLPFFDIAII